jgi:hypothetical protein
MARPAFLSSLGSKERRTPTGLKSPTQMDRDRENRQLPDNSRPDFLSDLGGGVPTGLKPPSQMDQSPFVSRAPSVDEIFAKNNIAEGTTNLGVGGSLPMTGSSNKAQQILGNNYARFLALGYTPSEIDAQLDRSLSYGRGIDVGKIEDQLNKFEQFNASGFNESGVAPMIDGEQFLSVSRPEIYANPSEGLGGLLSDMFRPFADMAGDVMQGIGEGKVGAMGLLNQLKDKFDSSVDKGKSFLDNLNQPGTLGFRVGALTQAQRRVYDDLIMNQGVSPFQAIEQAEKKAMGGITTLQ